MCVAVCSASSVASAAQYGLCQAGWSRAQADYYGCMYRKLDSSDKPRCLDRFLKKIADLHNLTDTPCADTRFVDQGDGTVIDNFTGLIWEKKTNADGVANPADPHDVDNTYAYTDVSDGDKENEDGPLFTDFLASLNAGSGFAGSNGWRVPTVVEIYSLYVNGSCSTAPCLDPLLLPYQQAEYSVYVTISRGTPQSNPLLYPGYTTGVETTPRSLSGIPMDGAFAVRAVHGGYANY